MKRARVLASGMVALLLGVTACQYRVPRDPETMVQMLVQDPSSLNPLLITDYYGQQVVRWVYESLLTQDNATLAWKPWLAESWDVSADHLHYTFHLRRDVRWHDGTPLTAADVVFTFDRINDPAVGSSLRVLFGEAGIRQATALDAHTVRFDLATPYYQALEILGGGLLVMPQHVFAGDTPMAKHPATRAPVGTGPYRFVAWEAGRSLVLDRNADSWRTVPGIARLQFRIIPDVDTAFLTLKKGEIDYQSLTELQWTRQAATPRFLGRFVRHRYLAQGFTFNYIGWNVRRPQLADKHVRQALTMLLPRQEIIDGMFFGLAQVATGPFHPRSPQCDQQIAPWPYDPARAAAQLSAAGWIDHDGDGVRDRNGTRLALTFLVAGSSRLIDALANIVRENFRSAGIDVTLRRLEWSVFLKTIREGGFDMMVGAWASSFDHDPYQLWHSSQIPKGSNYVGFAHADVDRLLTAARTEFDPAVRNAMYRRVHQILHDEQPYTFLFDRSSMVARHHRFTNVEQSPEAGLDISEWTVGPSEALFQ